MMMISQTSKTNMMITNSLTTMMTTMIMMMITKTTTTKMMTMKTTVITEAAEIQDVAAGIRIETARAGLRPVAAEAAHGVAQVQVQAAHVAEGHRAAPAPALLAEAVPEEATALQDVDLRL